MATTTELPFIDVQPRDRLGSRDSARLRNAGRLPAVMYGHKKQPLHVTMDRKQFHDLLHNQVHLLEVIAESDRQPCLIKEVQWNHLGSQIIHVDLTRVDLTERVTVSVELQLTGEAEGLKEAGAILEHPLNQLEIECQAANIPSSITADITELGVGASMTIAQIQMPEGVTAMGDPSTVIASISVLAEEADDEETPEAAEGEPEVIGKAEADAASEPKAD